MMNQNPNRKKLGLSDIHVSPLGIGIWSWGARFFWGYGKDYQETDLKEAFDVINQSDVNFIDTAEVYGTGMSEKILGNFSADIQDELVIATKFFPFPWRVDPNSARRAIRNSLKRLGLPHVDLYQIHMPFPPYPIEFWLHKLVPLYHDGIVKAVGVSNYNLLQTQRAWRYLDAAGVPLVSNQLRYSLLDRDIEKNGLMDYCHENDIAVIAYSPLAMGMLTGKYTPQNPPSFVRRRAYQYTSQFLEKIQPLLKLMEEIGRGRGDKTNTQVALNWAIAKGTIPIPGAKNARQVMDNIGTLNWQLTQDEVSALDRESDMVLGF
jgi:aryl-alcohol dehydrogenase-like predicted oxidoreductase